MKNVNYGYGRYLGMGLFLVDYFKISPRRDLRATWKASLMVKSLPNILQPNNYFVYVMMIQLSFANFRGKMVDLSHVKQSSQYD